ncbi:hypothetical protein FOXG_07160 [Fusarium oxysporum f. sp. lycopersici 4287]|uniref:SHSP domain-containing protein n=2 Tax=Fusarium oxysporum TaxID=5507 RepID=A0A0J9WN08_FUSO4|nr:hypothetical protein FOXG_07160 [Fusarium oxysporum f. sp. lycopersici 4287]KAJ9419453.1 PI31 proteasome regulator N-terminal-domain-containing protein [Fusarium oxysporum]KNB06457.1 hypothetical protein FOXG_07160 [Fusarium oxysporum f. sp. lycopersici 4287]
MSEHLSVTAILSGMADALPTHLPSDDSSDLASSYEAIALLIHSYLTALGFKLLDFDEDKKLPECKSLAPRLPPQWNSGLGSCSFLYSYKQSAMVLSIRVNPMGKKVEIQGLAVGDDNICRFERSFGEVVKSNKLPIRITTKDNEEDRSDLAEKLQGLFTSEQTIADILHDLELHIIQKLIPKLQSEGYVEPAKAEANARSERSAQVKEAMDHPASILKYRLERDGIPLALMETPDSPVLVPEGKTTHLAEASFKYCGTSVSELPGMNKKEMYIKFTEPQTIVIHRKAERTYTSGNPPEGFVEGPSAHRAIKGDVDNHNKSQPQQPEKSDKHDEKTKYWLAERRVGEFSRTFSFPSHINQDSVSASFQDGTLSIIVPMVEKYKSCRVDIN